MDTSEWIVLIGGIATIGWIIWYFFLGERRQVRAETAGGIQLVRIVVKGGYEPDVVVVERGKPVRLDFYRDESAGCSDTVVLGDFGIAKPLPAFKTTPVTFTPDKPGEFAFTCGMNMLRGKLIVEDAKAAREHGKVEASA